MTSIVPQKAGILPRGFTAQELASTVGAKVIGDPETIVTGINEIHVVESGDLAFVDHPKYYKKTLASKATAVLINQELEAPEGKVLLFHNELRYLREFQKGRHDRVGFFGISPLSIQLTTHFQGRVV